ncbi:GAF domain-containing protein [Cellulomonas sp. ATA003]|uniref:GAF domain-containing protein n=1 Tax=Cellulomonas sp. ATA003 TaxID=3073064 RepID=UPI00287343FB|nr:GAF domain-containing protein [Cellulomonas sp. ATA003]WNB87177.1 GAF domain-containing protein [Cellulomonas sp. ATA003]
MTSARHGRVGATPGTGARAVDTQELATVLNDFAATVTGDFSVGDILRQLGSGVTRVLDVDGAGVMTPRPTAGSLRTAFATAGLGEAVERLEECLGEGPSHDAYLTGDLVVVDDLASADRWPELERQVTTLGARAVTAVPMRARGRLWGVLSLYRLDDAPSRLPSWPPRPRSRTSRRPTSWWRRTGTPPGTRRTSWRTARRTTR